MGSRQKHQYRERVKAASQHQTSNEQAFWQDASPFPAPLEFGGAIKGIEGTDHHFHQPLSDKGGTAVYGKLKNKPLVSVHLPEPVAVSELAAALDGTKAQPKVLMRGAGDDERLEFIGKTLPREGDATGVTLLFKNNTPSRSIRQALENIKKI